MPLLAFFVFATSAAALSAPLDFESSLKLIQFPSSPAIDSHGKVKLADPRWKTEHDHEGTAILTAKSGDARLAILHESGKDAVEGLVSYRLKARAKHTKSSDEISSGLFFKNGKLVAHCSCEDHSATQKKMPGRICVTATEKLCQSLRTGFNIAPETLTEVDTFETRALASILTLRGSDHQLDNVINSGNRLGLKSALQTTKGQLIALARQVAKELGQPVAATPPELGARAKADEEMARTVLEKSLPRLKKACEDARFL